MTRSVCRILARAASVIALFYAGVSAAQISPQNLQRDESQRSPVVQGSEASGETGAELPPEMAVASASDAATAKNFEFLSWYSDGYYNEYYRFKAAREASKGDWAHAAQLFEIAARYGDKYSQHRLSLIHWHGAGAPKDHVLGYIWADLAAERGYPTLLAVREKMWEALTPQERATVAARGKPMLAKYGDAAAMPLFRGMLARQRALHFVLIRTAVPSQLQRYYPESYLAQEAVSWKKIRVDIGDIERDSTARTEPVVPPKSDVGADAPTTNDIGVKPSKPSP